jgi:hypothetical protein
MVRKDRTASRWKDIKGCKESKMIRHYEMTIFELHVSSRRRSLSHTTDDEELFRLHMPIEGRLLLMAEDNFCGTNLPVPVRANNYIVRSAWSRNSSSSTASSMNDSQQDMDQKMAAKSPSELFDPYNTHSETNSQPVSSTSKQGGSPYTTTTVTSDEPTSPAPTTASANLVEAWRVVSFVGRRPWKRRQEWSSYSRVESE